MRLGFRDSNNQFEELKKIKLLTVTFTFNEVPKKIFGASCDFYTRLRPDNPISILVKK